MIVLAYHRVTRLGKDPLAVSTDAFRKQVRWLKMRKYQMMSLKDVLSDQTPRTRKVAITFDDGYEDNFLNAIPILLEEDASATFFLTTDYVSNGQPFPWSVPYEEEENPNAMSWEQIRQASRYGFEIGSHTCNHPKLSQLADDELIFRELSFSKKKIEAEIGCEVLSVCYPAGYFDERVIKSAHDAGYRFGVVTPRADCDLPVGPLTVRRSGVYANDNGLRFMLKLSPLFDAYRSVRRARAALFLSRKEKNKGGRSC